MTIIATRKLIYIVRTDYPANLKCIAEIQVVPTKIYSLIRCQAAGYELLNFYFQSEIDKLEPRPQWEISKKFNNRFNLNPDNGVKSVL